MELNFSEKLAICYISCGPTYRESLIKKLKENYFDHENLHYFILTDDKSFFKDLPFKNLCVKELKDYYEEFPEIAQYENLIYSKDVEDYAVQFVNTNYRFPFSITRFLLLEAYKANITNILLIVSDTFLRFDGIDETAFEKKNMIYNAVSEWDEYIWNNNMEIVARFLQKKYNLICDNYVRILDACARLFIFENINDAKKLFDIWHDVIMYIYSNNLIRLYQGSYANNDEYILAPIYNVLNLNKALTHAGGHAYFSVNHEPRKDRYWVIGDMKSHTNYEEFLKINNLTHE